MQTFEVVDKTDNSVTLKLMRFGVPNGNKTHPSERFEISWTEVGKSDQELTTIET